VKRHLYSSKYSLLSDDNLLVAHDKRQRLNIFKMLIFIQDYLENGTQNATKISSEIIESRSTGRSVTAQS
jgi:hypothetical protein